MKTKIEKKIFEKILENNYCNYIHMKNNILLGFLNQNRSSKNDITTHTNRK